MSRCRLATLQIVRAAATAAFVAQPLQAQLVRGTASDASSQAPLAGVVIELLRLDSPEGDTARVAAALSDGRGAFAVRATGAGRFVLAAKRIGVRRYHSAPFTLNDGETLVKNVALEPVSFVLPEIVVTGLNSCAGESGTTDRAASLWEEARTALFAAQLSLRDSLFTAHVTRYLRELEPRSRRVLNEYRSETRGVVARPFVAIDPDTLSAHGYVRGNPDGSSTWMGPDAEVLLSDAFVRDHCFREVRGDRSRRGMVGLGFRPVRDTSIVDIIGTLWLDEKSYELRFVEFAYNRVPSGANPADIGGEVHFARLESGAWVVRRWFIRLPVTARPAPPVGTAPGATSWVLVRPTTLMLREEGGDVAADGVRGTLLLARVNGVLTDSARRPLAGARLRVAGTRLSVVTDAAGRFSIDSVPVGHQHLVAEVAGYDSLGLAAADARVDVRARGMRSIALRALNGRDLYERLCSGRSPLRDRGALRILVRSATGDSVVRGLPLSVSWLVPRPGIAADSTPRTLNMTSDDRGSAIFCDMPSTVTLRVIVTRMDGGSSQPVEVTVPPRGVRGLIVPISR